jgi:hypothetical protein
MEIIRQINICEKCYYNIQCINCINENDCNILSQKQINVLNKINNNCFSTNNNIYGLYGQAGTGKTLLIANFIKYKYLYNLFISKYICKLLNIEKINKTYKLTDIEFNKLKFINIDHNIIKIAICAPTHKALHVLEEKLKDIQINHIKISFLTVSQLLSHKANNSWNGEKIFKRNSEYRNIFDIYDLIIIDECSMLSKFNVNDIKNDLETSKTKNGYIIFVGDKAQLPPVGEKLSEIFVFINQYSKLKTIERTNSDNIISLAKYIRKNILNTLTIKNIKIDKLLSFSSNNIIFFKDYNKFINKYISTYNLGNNILLTYTNNSKNLYNKNIIKQIPSDIYIFNDYFYVNDKTTFYSSCRIIINEEENEDYTCSKFNFNLIKFNIDEAIKKRKINHKILKELSISFNYNYLMDIIEKLIRNINLIFPSIYKVNRIKSCNIIIDNKISENEIKNLIYIHKSNKKIFNINNDKIKQLILNFINEFDNILNIQMKKNIIKYVWNEYDNVIKNIFIDIDYSNSITVNKSQGSTYENIFIDYKNIFEYGHNIEAKQRFYTAITRASKFIYILI